MNNIAKFRKLAGLSQEQLAQAVGTTNQQIGRLESGARELTESWMRRLAPALGVEPADLMDGQKRTTTQVIGFVGAGAEAHFYGMGDHFDDEVALPAGSTEKTVAVRVRGSSLGPIFENALLFYDDVRTPPTPDMLRKLCVVGLPNGQVLVKRLLPGTKRGLFHLLSNTEGIIENAALEWAAVVKTVTPL